MVEASRELQDGGGNLCRKSGKEETGVNEGEERPAQGKACCLFMSWANLPLFERLDWLNGNKLKPLLNRDPLYWRLVMPASPEFILNQEKLAKLSVTVPAVQRNNTVCTFLYRKARLNNGATFPTWKDYIERGLRLLDSNNQCSLYSMPATTTVINHPSGFW